jgi:ThiF family
MKKCTLRIAYGDYEKLMLHLFPGDNDEHGAIILAGISQRNNLTILYVREIHLACTDTDYVESDRGYRALSPSFIHRCITRARDQRLVYLAVHNHASDLSVGFSEIDMKSHQRGYTALLQIAKGMPVGALVFGQRSVQADIWLADGGRLDLDRAVVIGNVITQLFPSCNSISHEVPSEYERQVRMFGKKGQMQLADCRVGIIGLGGIGSLVAEYLARLGVQKFYLVDEDILETTNLSRVVGSSVADVKNEVSKVEIARRNILQANGLAEVHVITDDVAKESVARQLSDCDYLFLAADSMRARLVFNALVHQYLIPGVQLGSKVRPDDQGDLLDVVSVNRPVRPGAGCLWCNQLIDPTQLAKEAKSDEERKAQAYGTEEPNPSVISLNAVSAAHAVNDFLMDYLGLREDHYELYYEYFNHLKRARTLVQPRKDDGCSECSHDGLRYGRGDMISLPCLEA